MLLRFRGRDGQFRLNLEPKTEFTSILPQILEHLPANVDPNTITLNNQPHGGDPRVIVTLNGIRLEQVGLRYGAVGFDMDSWLMITVMVHNYFWITKPKTNFEMAILPPNQKTYLPQSRSPPTHRRRLE